jgi:hypothetical protein
VLGIQTAVGSGACEQRTSGQIRSRAINAAPRKPERPHARRPEDLADALAFALRFDGRKRKHDAAEMIARIVAKRLVEHLERAGFVVMKRPPIGGAAALGRGYEGR